ncbi:MAG TPA: metallophosphoesterase [Actinomycetota bacterium]|nr:metallophosphoesterase [Actinomycetota bacterium]
MKRFFVAVALCFGVFLAFSSPPFQEARASDEPVIVAAGDIACLPGDMTAPCQDQQTAALLTGADRVLPLGDNQYDAGALSDYLARYDLSWGQYKSNTAPVPGNHEYRTVGAAGYFDYFDGVDAPTGPAGDRDKGYYSYDIGTWHLIALNANCGPNGVIGGCTELSPQMTWLASDLANNPATCTLAYWHQPRFSSMHTDTPMGAAWRLLYDNGADVVLNGHQHNYERFAPMAPDGSLDKASGIREFIVGTGGSSLSPYPQTYPTSKVEDASSFGVLKITLYPQKYDWEFVPAGTGTFTDSGTARCDSPGALDGQPPPSRDRSPTGG